MEIAGIVGAGHERPMISVIITNLGDGARLTATLAALAPAAIDGFVREALAVDAGTGEAALAAAEDAGARAIRAADEAQGLAAACAAARGPWLLILPAGTRLSVGWETSARRHIERHAERAGWFALALDADGLGARAAEIAANIGAAWLGRPSARQGLLLSKRCYERAAEGGAVAGHAGLVRKLGGGTSRGLSARALS